MTYSEAEIKKYLDIVHKYTKSPKKETDRKTRCWNCQDTDFEIDKGFKICENCGSQNEAVLGYLDKRDQDRLVFRKKSIYQRKYHYEKRVEELGKMIQLTEDEKYDLYSKLLEIDNKVMEKLNKQFKRKRSISIIFLIKKILEEIKNPKHSLVEINIGDQTLENYEKWWHCYKSLK